LISNKYLLGAGLVLIGGLFLSLSGIMLRNIDSADGWQVLFYRSLMSFVTIAVILVFQYRRNAARTFLAIGRPGLVAATVLGIGSMFYILAMVNTTVANVVFIIGAAPLITALGGWLFLGEKVTRGGLVAMVMAIAGIGLMFADGFVSGGMLGNLYAFGVVISFMVFLLILRKHKHLDMLPATCLSGLVAAAVALLFCDSLKISSHDLVIALMLGSLQFGVGFMLLTWGTRYIPAAEVALFSLSESVLNPLWVFLYADEVPSVLSLLGSAVVLISVIAYSIAAIIRERGTNLVQVRAG